MNCSVFPDVCSREGQQLPCEAREVQHGQVQGAVAGSGQSLVSVQVWG